MGKKISESDLAEVEAILQNRPEGLAMGDLVGTGASETVRRAMQRRLKRLIEDGRANKTGTGRGTRYFALDQATKTAIHTDEANLDEEGGLLVPISTTGQQIQELVNRPKNKRQPVGYNRSFLSSYIPNQTYFLSHRERQFLTKLSRVDSDQQSPAGTYARHILDRLLIDLSWNSSRLEGNTYSILDTHILFEQGKVAEGKTAEETQMVINHKEAIEYLIDTANEIGFNRHTILNLHSILANNIFDPEASGRLRQKVIGIGKSVYEPLQVPALIEDRFNEILVKAEAIADPFEQSFFVSIQLPYLQPFADVNKRVSRLAANIPFIKQNLSPISFIDVSKDVYTHAILAVYELNKTELARDMFVWAYERSARKYAIIKQSLGSAPDTIKLKYHDLLRKVVSEIIQSRLPKSKATTAIRNYASQEIPDEDQHRFTEVAEAELLGLHEGNFGRYRVRPTEYFAWKSIWEAN